MQIPVRLLPLKGPIIETDIEVSLDGRPTIQKVIEAVVPSVSKMMPMAGYRAFINNLIIKEDYKKLVTFDSGDVLTVMELPLSVVMP